MRGRPRKPESLKAAEGYRSHTTRAELFSRLQSATEAVRGRPDLPLSFRASKADEPRTKALKTRARHYWSLMLDDLEREGRLYLMDAPFISAAAQTRALMDFAFEQLADAAHNNLGQAYRQYCDRLGLNPSSRSKLPQQAKPAVSALDSALCA